jgi:PAS domain S-box-containing protein
MCTSSQPISGVENLKKVSDGLFRVLIEFKDYAIVMVDADGHVIGWNLGAKHMYGYSGEEIIGKHISVFYATKEETRNEQPSIDLKTAKETGRCEYEGWKYKKDGTTFYANTIVTVLHNKDGSLKGFANVTRDITRRKKLEEENKLLTSQFEEKVDQRTNELPIVVKELEAFSYSVSHDLRAPLRAISGYSIMLKEDYQSKLDAEGNRIIDVIIDNTKMTSQLIDDLLTFSKMARLEVVRDSIDMKRLAEKCAEELLQTEKRTDYAINILDLPECKGDENMLKQVWFNLIGNAIKYSFKKLNPQIEVSAIDDGKTNIYYVRDNGAGFDMKYSSKLFGVFQRLHRSDEFKGTGVGLALAKRIISKHSGEIWAEAELDKGAVFYFSIPK